MKPENTIRQCGTPLREFDINLTSVETVLRRSPLVALGEYRCPVDHPQFSGGGPQRCPFVVFPRSSVRLTRLEAVGSPYSCPGVSSERIDLFLAAYGAADRVAAGGGVAEENEHITVEEVPLALLWTWVEQRRIEDLKSLALILALRVRRPELFA